MCLGSWLEVQTRTKIIIIIKGTAASSSLVGTQMYQRQHNLSKPWLFLPHNTLPTAHCAQPTSFLLVLLSVFASGVGADLERLAAKLTPDTASLIYCLLYPIYISYQNLQKIFCCNTWLLDTIVSLELVSSYQYTYPSTHLPTYPTLPLCRTPWSSNPETCDLWDIWSEYIFWNHIFQTRIFRGVI